MKLGVAPLYDYELESWLLLKPTNKEKSLKLA